jgi:hypothetical protein
VRNKIIGLATAVAIFTSTLVATPAYGVEQDSVTPTVIPTTSLPDAPLVENVQITTDQGAKPADKVKVTAKTNAPVEKTKDSISIVNADTNETVQTCDTGSTCEYDYTTVDFAPDTKFFARTANMTSSNVEIVNPAPTLTLISSVSESDTEENVELEAKIDGDLPEDKLIYFVYEPTGEVVYNCSKWYIPCYYNFFMNEHGQGTNTYKAYIADEAEATNTNQLTNIVAVSNTVDIAQTEWNFQLTTESPVVEEGSHFFLDGQLNQVIPEGYKVYFYDITAKEFVISDIAATDDYCSSDKLDAERCSTSFAYDTQRTYQAYLARVDENITASSLLSSLKDVRTISNTLTIKQLPWKLSVETSPVWFSYEGNVVYVPKLNQPTRYYYYALIRPDSGEIYVLCSGNGYCQTDMETPSPAQVAAVGLTMVVGRWSGDTSGKEAEIAEKSSPGGYMYDIQESLIYAAPGYYPYKDRPSLATPFFYTGGLNFSSLCPQTCVADPVNTVTGEFWLDKKRCYCR